MYTFLLRQRGTPPENKVTQAIRFLDTIREVPSLRAPALIDMRTRIRAQLTARPDHPADEDLLPVLADRFDDAFPSSDSTASGLQTNRLATLPQDEVQEYDDNFVPTAAELSAFETVVNRVETRGTTRRARNAPDPRRNDDKARDAARTLQDAANSRGIPLRRLVRCLACGRIGHEAHECDQLAMYLWIVKFLRTTKDSEARDRALARWEERFERLKKWRTQNNDRGGSRRPAAARAYVLEACPPTATPAIALMANLTQAWNRFQNNTAFRYDEQAVHVDDDLDENAIDDNENINENNENQDENENENVDKNDDNEIRDRANAAHKCRAQRSPDVDSPVPPVAPFQVIVEDVEDDDDSRLQQSTHDEMVLPEGMALAPISYLRTLRTVAASTPSSTTDLRDEIYEDQESMPRWHSHAATAAHLASVLRQAEEDGDAHRAQEAAATLDAVANSRDPLPHIARADGASIPPTLPCDPSTLDYHSADVPLHDVDNMIGALSDALLGLDCTDGTETVTRHDPDPLLDALVREIRLAADPVPDRQAANAIAAALWRKRLVQRRGFLPAGIRTCVCDISCTNVGPTQPVCAVTCFDSAEDNSLLTSAIAANRRHTLQQLTARRQRLHSRLDILKTADDSLAAIPIPDVRDAFEAEARDGADPDIRRDMLSSMLRLRVNLLRQATGRHDRRSFQTDVDDMLDEVHDDWGLGPEDDPWDDDDGLIPIIRLADVNLTSSSGKRADSPGVGMMDSGANILLCGEHFSRFLEDIEDITPIPLGVAVSGTTQQYITKRGWLPMMMADGTPFRVLMHIHPSANDTIMSPEAIMYSHDSIYRWSQEGCRNGHGRINFYSRDNTLLLSMELRSSNRLYYYEMSLPSVTLESTLRQLGRDRAKCFRLQTPVGGETASPDDAPPTTTTGATATSEEETSKPSPPPARTPARRAPVTLAQQLESEQWALRMGSPGVDAMQELAKHATGLPNQFNFHPFSYVDHKVQAYIRKQAAGRTAEKATDKAQRFFMDFGFIRASKSDFSRPNLKTDRVVESFDGYSSYLIVVDEVTRHAWVFLCKSKEPPINYVSEFLYSHGLKSGGVIRCDQGGELARSKEFRKVMLERHHYKVEPTGADSPSQNGGAERLNGSLAVLVRTLLYGAELEPKYWSAALVHAVYLYNRRVHSVIKRTPYEAWHGVRPDLRRLRTFGSRVCVKRTGHRRAKLDKHHFTGIFIGYSATDRNIRYIDLDSSRRDVRTCAHAVFDEAWYLQPSRPPAAELLYNLGLRDESDFVASPLAPAPERLATYPPLKSPGLKCDDMPRARMFPLPLGEVFSPRPMAAAAARVSISPYADTSMAPTVNDVDLATSYGVTRRDLAQIYLSPHPYEDAFEETLQMATFKQSANPLAGLRLDNRDGRLILREMMPGTPGHRIPRWKSRLRQAWLVAVNGIEVSTTDEVATVLSQVIASDQPECSLLFAKPEIRHGLTNDGIPQVNLDQLNPRSSFGDLPPPSTLATPPPRVHTIWDTEGDVHEWHNASAYKLTRGAIMKSADREEWIQSEFAQLDQYDAQGMFGAPVRATSDLSIFNLVWSYVVKELDKRKKARCTCDGSSRGGQVRVLDHTYANCVDHTSSRLFYALAAKENLVIHGADVTNAFGEASPPKQGFYIRPDAAVRAWWRARRGVDLGPHEVIPILAAMQGHPEAGRLWEKHADAILRRCGLTPTTHEPCLYSGLIDGERVLFMRQVDDFAVATPSERIANILFDMIDDALTFPLKRMGLVSLFNGLDITQTKEYIKVSVNTYAGKILPKYMDEPVNLRVHDIRDNRPTPLPSRGDFERKFIQATGDPDPRTQRELASKMGFNYRGAVGELIYAMVTCRPDLSYGVVRASQANSCPAEIHYQGVKHMLKYLSHTKSDGIYFWRQELHPTLPSGPMPTINSNEHDLMRDGRPLDYHDRIVGYVDADWASCTKTRRSVTGVCIRLAGGTVAYKSRLQPTVAQSSTEAEFMGANDAGKTILFLRSILWDLGVPQTDATLLYEDNDACTAMANARKPTSRTRHMDIKYHVLCEWVDRDLLKLVRIDTSLNMADHHTKSLGPALFHRHNDYILGHVPPTYSPMCCI
ncbi:hypothetical protein THAOC_08742 [Thalassiosira oceanica]|uniref:Uncharacterized protein n=1 Tax=Thalassiosira oceanica TaxID=159749 RepID=K0SWY3_THAOC|nr:hypothetical protein THAOC_08742 [Thalassiosira oceanica]|eukprot:EJK69950.1 hypothetical protein THAOC_08742 [Thalassiosira oceanica]